MQFMHLSRRDARPVSLVGMADRGRPVRRLDAPIETIAQLWYQCPHYQSKLPLCVSLGAFTLRANTMPLPRIIADTPLAPAIETLLAGKVEVLPWTAAAEPRKDVAALYTYGHPLVDGPMLDRLPGL